MAIVAVATGIQTAVVNTEHSLTQQTGVGAYVLKVDLSAMDAGDSVTIRLKDKVLSAGSSGITQEATLSDAQTVVHWRSEPIPVDVEIICTLEQTAGSSRDFPWALLRA